MAVVDLYSERVSGKSDDYELVCRGMNVVPREYHTLYLYIV